MSAISKTNYAAARRCELRGYRNFILGEWGAASRNPVTPQLAMYRAKDLAIQQIHRLVVRGGHPNPDALAHLWSDVYRRAGGIGPAPDEGLLWLRAYVNLNPFELGSRRRPLFVELTLTSEYLGYRWVARPDLIAELNDGSLVALELTAARHPLLDLSGLRVMAAIDQLVLHRSADWPDSLRERVHRVAICSTETWDIHDVTLTSDEGREVLSEIVDWLELLPVQHPARPSVESCGACPYHADCEHAWRLEEAVDLRPHTRHEVRRFKTRHAVSIDKPEVDIGRVVQTDSEPGTVCGVTDQVHGFPFQPGCSSSPVDSNGDQS